MPRIQAAPMWSLGYFRIPPPTDPRPMTQKAMFWEAQMEMWLSERLDWRDTGGLDVRSPGHMWSIAHAPTNGNEHARNWHHDGGPNNPVRYLGGWSNTLGTEIKLATPRARKIYQAEPEEFLVFDNAAFVHRPPRNATEEEKATRWFVRLYTNGPLRQHPDILECLLP